MECLEKQVVSVVVLGRNVQKLVADTLFGSKGIKDLKCCAKAVEAGGEYIKKKIEQHQKELDAEQKAE